MAETEEQFNLLRTAFMQKVTMTCNRLGIEVSTAIILLVHYQWNQDALLADWEAMSKLLPVVQSCAEVIESHVVNGAICCNCGLPQPCHLINCGHHVCDACVTALINNNLNRRVLNVICPSNGCHMFINYSNLPNALRHIYLSSLLVDFVDKSHYAKTRLAKCVDILRLHKKKVFGCLSAMTLFSLSLYKYRAWEQDNPWTAYFVRVGVLFKLNKKVPMPWNS